MKVISNYNQKGGVGKTTATIQEAGWTAFAGYRVLVIDADIQANLTNALLNNSPYIEDPEYAGFAEVAAGQTELDDIILHASVDLKTGLAAKEVGIDIAPINRIREYKFFTTGAYAVRDILDKVKDRYDFVFIDYPPERPYIGTIEEKEVYNLVALCLIATDAIIIPCTPDEDSFSGLEILDEHIGEIRRQYNPHLQNLGCFLNMVGRYNADRFIQELCDGPLKDSVLYCGHTIRTSGIIKSSRLKYRPLAWYFSRNQAAESYRKLTEYITGEQIKQ